MLSARPKIPRKSKGQAGFTLAELAIVLTISGLILCAAIAAVVPVLRMTANIQTQAKLDNIARAIDFYAMQNNRVPCPGVPDTSVVTQPFGYEMGSQSTGSVVPTTCPTSGSGWQGIVPYKTLNIPVDWAKDAWGHYITYAISPNYSQDVTNAALSVQARCRTSDWFSASIVYGQNFVDESLTGPNKQQIITNIIDPTTGLPASDVLIQKNEKKARFCCSGAAAQNTDLVIDDVNGNSQLATLRDTNAADYAASNVTYPNPMVSNVQVPSTERATAPVYILISAGPDGYGAYTGLGATARLSVAGATSHEIANASDYGTGTARIFYDIPPLDRSGTEQGFDDVVLWRTQDMIFAEQGGSCSLP